MEYKDIIAAMDRELEDRQERLTTVGIFAAGIAFTLIASQASWWMVYVAFVTTIALEVHLLNDVTDYKSELSLQGLTAAEERWLETLEKQRFSFRNHLRRCSFFTLGLLLLFVASATATG